MLSICEFKYFLNSEVKGYKSLIYLSKTLKHLIAPRLKELPLIQTIKNIVSKDVSTGVEQQNKNNKTPEAEHSDIVNHNKKLKKQGA